MGKAAADLEERAEPVTARALAQAAHISLNTACTWLRLRETGALDRASALSVVQYSSYSSSDNIPVSENRANTAIVEHRLCPSKIYRQQYSQSFIRAHDYQVRLRRDGPGTDPN